jgi:uncharacterized protein (TIGR02186 family)
MKKLLFLLVALSATLAAQVRADSGLVTELGEQNVDITARFAGEKMLIFGAVSRPGDVIVKVVSPTQTVDLSHKEKFGPFWLTAGKVRVENTPGLFYVLSNKPVDQLLNRAQRRRYGLDLTDALRDAKVTGQPAEAWQDAFIRLKRTQENYRQDGQAVKLVRDQLFSTSMHLPAKLPLGKYRLEIYRVRGGRLRGHQERTFEVREVKLEHWVSKAAYTHPWSFGILFTLLALTIGLVLGIALRKGDR